MDEPNPTTERAKTARRLGRRLTDLAEENAKDDSEAIHLVQVKIILPILAAVIVALWQWLRA